jgi:hypothetical protein
MNSRRRHGRWTVVVRDIHLGPIPLGYITRLEDGLLFRGPSSRLPAALNWWWRPTQAGAFNRAHDEVHALEHPKARH